MTGTPQAVPPEKLPAAAPARPARAEDDPARYRQIAKQLETAISVGRYPVGALLPTEAALCTSFGASRYTIREALRTLVDLGMVERRQGAGSRVVAAAPRTSYSHTMRTLAEFFQYARDTHLEIMDSGIYALDDDEALVLKAPVGSRWMRIQGVRWNPARTETISYTTVYIHVRFVPLLADVSSAEGPIYALVEARSGETIAEAIQEITACALPATIAKPLNVRPGAPAMRFVRRYLDASGGIMLTSLNWHPADRFSYVMSIRRGDWPGQDS
ncbi:GntR family transcriptional regulator [Xanthobacter pseudotagetidis]|uniref:GntR family transcriptional regulator n=1 Tax=Xanthobacter pseudotagetidis TaxID=3119911 RepID=UPI00372BE303